MSKENDQSLEHQVAEAIVNAVNKSNGDVFEVIKDALSNIGLNEKYRKDYEAVEDYKRMLRRRYQSEVDDFEKHFPNGVYTKDSNGGFVGVNIMVKSMIKGLCSINKSDTVVFDYLVYEEDQMLYIKKASYGDVEWYYMIIEDAYRTPTFRLLEREEMEKRCPELDLNK